jgi:ectoine hydroxylase-related dioxygenase (phytanoyl-CoA dioxygenase family)
MMTPEQRYWFDLTGYLHLKQVLQGDEFLRVQEAVDRYLKAPPETLPDGYRIRDKEYHHAIGFDRSLDALAVHPATWPIIREFTNGRPQMSGSGVVCNERGEGALPLHCARDDFGFDATRYEFRDGHILCNDFVVFFYLSEVRPGDGGLLLVPGSHKSALSRPPEMFHGGEIDNDIPPGVVNITPDAGDVVIFSELTTHGVIAWRPQDRRRRMVNYRYKTQQRGYEHRYTPVLKALLPPELVQLVSDEDYMHKKKIAEADVVELS